MRISNKKMNKMELTNYKLIIKTDKLIKIKHKIMIFVMTLKIWLKQKMIKNEIHPIYLIYI